MLNIYKLKKKENLTKFKYNQGDLYGKLKDTIPASKEWFNSIYAYNKNSLTLLPIADNVVSKIIKSYFNMFSSKIEKTKTRRMDLRAKIRSAHKIWVSKPEIKHTNSKLTITLYIYDRQSSYIANKLVKMEPMWQPNMINGYFKNISLIYNRISIFLSNINKLNNTLLKIFLKNKHRSLKSKNPLLLKYISEILNKEVTYLRFKQIILFNRFKFNTFISCIKQILQKLYNKNVEFNLVSLKNFHLNSNILSQIITKKIRNKNNNPTRVLRASLRKVRTPVLNDKTIERKKTKLIEAQNLIVRDLIEIDKKNFDLCLTNNNKWYKDSDLEIAVLNNTKYKLVSGIKLMASGRITRRIIAERARYKVISIGSLKNINSSYKGLSSVMVRGYMKSNIENTLLRSETHVGAFGLKGWISSY